jgi:hypothetical protein
MGFAYYECKIAYGEVLSNNISQLTMIDENCIFPIFTGANPPITGDYTYSEFSSMMGEIYGNGYSMMDGVGRDIWLEQGKLWFPNLNNIFGAVNSFIDSGGAGSGNSIWIIIPKMHRVFRGSSSDVSNITGFFTLNNDGSFVSTPGNGSIYDLIIPVIISGQGLYWFHSYGSTLDDFKNAANWNGEFYITFNTSDPNTKRSLQKRSRSISQSVITALFSDAEEPEILSEDPYSPGGESGPGGGTGDFDGTGDDIDFPSLPTLSAVDTGFITLFNPSANELRSLANYMWSTGFDLDTFKKLFADPMDAILGLSIVPVNVPNGGSRAVSVGNISTGVTMNVAASQYVEVDCGTLNVNEYWGAYLDYDPYTKAELYLPYIGTRPIAVDDIMNKAVHIKYHIDVLSGACCAFVKCGGSVLYSFVGQCSCSIPITGNDWTNVVNGALSIAASIGTMVATGGATAPMAAATIASTAVNSMKPNVEKSGSMGGMGGMLGVQTPYLILTRPRQCLPARQNDFEGYPSYITRNLSDVRGYTVIESVHLEGITATDDEKSEIESILKTGVIF